MNKQQWDLAVANPPTLNHIIGNQKIVEQLRITMEACFADNRPFPHTLFHGGKGTGKTTLAQIVSREMGCTKLVEILGHNVSWPGEVTQVLLELDEQNGFVFIDEIQTMNHSAQVALFRAMEEQRVFLDPTPWKSKPKAVKIPKFTLLAASTNIERILPPLMDRFLIVSHLMPLSSEEVVAMLKQRANALHWNVESAVYPMIASRSRGVPRIALRLFDSVRRTSRSEYSEAVRVVDAVKTFELEGLAGEIGLTNLEQDYLRALLEMSAEGRPVRLHMMVAKLGLPLGTVMRVVEPTLVKEGMILKSNEGRQITGKGLSLLQSYESS